MSELQHIVVDDIDKSHIKGHYRKTSTGGQAWVREHEDRRTKKPEEEGGEKWGYVTNSIHGEPHTFERHNAESLAEDYNKLPGMKAHVVPHPTEPRYHAVRYDTRMHDVIAAATEERKKTDKPIWDMTLDEYAPYPSAPFYAPDMDVFKNYSRRKNEWNQKMRERLSLGKITFDAARKLGYTYEDSYEFPENGGWKPLPKTLYHVTTGLSGVQKEGLKTREELNQHSGKGLGGGSRQAISFTDDLKTGHAILNGVLEMRQVARGEITASDLLEMARKGEDAERPFLSGLMTFWGSHYENWKEGDPYPPGLMAILTGKEHKNTMLPSTKPPTDDPGWVRTGDLTWERQMSDAEQRDAAVSLYKRFAAMREHAGGPTDPLFFSSDTEGLANTKLEDIALVKFSPMEGSQGYQCGALGEWRTGSGKAVQLDKIVSAGAEQQKDPDPVAMSPEEFNDYKPPKPTKRGYRLLYHVTRGSSNIESILKNGLKLDHARNTGEPAFVWATTDPNAHDTRGSVIIFQVPEKDATVNYEAAGLTQARITRDISPEDIMSVDREVNTPTTGPRRLSDMRIWDAQESSYQKANNRHDPSSLYHAALVEEALKAGKKPYDGWEDDYPELAGKYHGVGYERVTHKSARDFLKGAQNHIDELEQDLAAAGHPYINAGAKSAKSAANKVNRKRRAGVEDYSLHSMGDTVRGAVLPHDEKGLMAALHTLAARGYEPEVYVAEPLNASGYRAVHLRKRFGPNGEYGGEVQVHTKEGWELKKKTDEVYAKWRNKQAKDLTDAEREEYTRDYEESNRAWTHFWDKSAANLATDVDSLDSMIRSAFSSGTGLASEKSATVMPSGGETHSPESGSNTKSLAGSTSAPESVIANLVMIDSLEKDFSNQNIRNKIPEVKSEEPELIVSDETLSSSSETGTYVEKSHVKGHYRRDPSGQQVWVKDYEDARTKKPDEGPTAYEVSPEIADEAQSAIAEVEKHRAEFEEDVSSVGYKFQIAPKSQRSIVQKIVRHRRRGEKGYGIKDMPDILRGQIFADTTKDFKKVIEKLSRRGFHVKVHIDKPYNNFGYRGVFLSKKLGEIGGEVQLHTPVSIAVKDRTDSIYRKWRNIDPATLTPKDMDMRDHEREVSNELWSDFWEAQARQQKMSLDDLQREYEDAANVRVAPEFVRNGLFIEGDNDHLYRAVSYSDAQQLCDTHLPVRPPKEGKQWEDGSDGERLYFSYSPNDVARFIPDDGETIVIRTHKAPGRFIREEGTGRVYTENPVRSIDVEYYGEDKEWHPLAGLRDEESQKSYALSKKYTFRGLPISIETAKGEYREGTDGSGNKWRVRMPADYGYIRGTQSVGEVHLRGRNLQLEGDAVDVFVGPDKTAEKVYIIHTQNPETKEYDEDKAFIGFSSVASAKRAFFQAYNSRGFFHSMDTIPFDEFKSKMSETAQLPSVIR